MKILMLALALSVFLTACISQDQRRFAAISIELREIIEDHAPQARIHISRNRITAREGGEVTQINSGGGWQSTYLVQGKGFDLDVDIGLPRYSSKPEVETACNGTSFHGSTKFSDAAFLNIWFIAGYQEPQAFARAVVNTLKKE